MNLTNINPVYVLSFKKHTDVSTYLHFLSFLEDELAYVWETPVKFHRDQTIPTPYPAVLSMRTSNHSDVLKSFKISTHGRPCRLWTLPKWHIHNWSMSLTYDDDALFSSLLRDSNNMAPSMINIQWFPLSLGPFKWMQLTIYLTCIIWIVDLCVRKRYQDQGQAITSFIYCIYFSPPLTHWGRVTHICVIKLTIIGSDNGLSPGRRQAIIWANAGILSIGHLGTNFSEILFEIQTFSFKKIQFKMSSAKWRPFCLGLNVLIPASDTQILNYGRLLLGSDVFFDCLSGDKGRASWWTFHTWIHSA